MASSFEIASPGEMDTEVVEEFISIADGQVVLEGSRADGGEGCYQVSCSPWWCKPCWQR